MEHDIEWDRIRASTVKTPAHDLHLSDCLDELQPGDHIEIQWRRNKDFPYGNNYELHMCILLIFKGSMNQFCPRE